MDDPTFETLLLSQRAWNHPDLDATYGAQSDDWSVLELSEYRIGFNKSFF